MKLFLYTVLLVALLGGLFVLFKPQSPPPAPAAAASVATPAAPVAPSAPVAPPPPAAVPSPPPPAVFDLVIRRGQLVSGPTVIQVKKDDEVIIHITADTADELHLHGYDLHVKTRPGETATLQFSAARTGRFGYELHHGKSELGALEVYPR